MLVLVMLTIHSLATAYQHYGFFFKTNKQPFNQQNSSLFHPKALYQWLEHPREPVGITH